MCALHSTSNIAENDHIAAAVVILTVVKMRGLSSLFLLIDSVLSIDAIDHCP